MRCESCGRDSDDEICKRCRRLRVGGGGYYGYNLNPQQFPPDDQPEEDGEGEGEAQGDGGAAAAAAGGVV